MSITSNIVLQSEPSSQTFVSTTMQTPVDDRLTLIVDHVQSIVVARPTLLNITISRHNSIHENWRSGSQPPLQPHYETPPAYLMYLLQSYTTHPKVQRRLRPHHLSHPDRLVLQSEDDFGCVTSSAVTFRQMHMMVSFVDTLQDFWQPPRETIPTPRPFHHRNSGTPTVSIEPRRDVSAPTFRSTQCPCPPCRSPPVTRARQHQARHVCAV